MDVVTICKSFSIAYAISLSTSVLTILVEVPLRTLSIVSVAVVVTVTSVSPILNLAPVALKAVLISSTATLSVKV